MKRKYYLRGMGFGILLTAIIVIIAYAVYSPEMSDEDVIRRARELGMVSASGDASENSTLAQNDRSWLR